MSFPFRREAYTIKDDADEGPPSPFWGNPIDVRELELRNKKSKERCERLCSFADDLSTAAVGRSKIIPVMSDKDKIFVTPEVNKQIGEISTEEDIQKLLLSNSNEVQRTLNLRVATIKMMNVNYDKTNIADPDAHSKFDRARTTIEYR
jgi:hypothetical protein